MKKRTSDYSTFNVIAFLDSIGVSYRTSGKNISNGWVGVESCPFCGGGGFHFAIKLQSNTGNCWLCGNTGNTVKIVGLLGNVNWPEAKKIIEKYSSDTVDWAVLSDYTGESVIFPDGILPTMNRKCRKYLESRRYNPDAIKEQFKVKCTENYSTLYLDGREWDFSERIICPVFMNRQIQCYVARDYTGEASPKYMNSPIVASIRKPHSCIYNYDTLKGKIILVEGVTDVWRLGAKVGALLGITFTNHQIRALAEKDISEVTVLFDDGAYKRANELATALTSVIPSVRTAVIEEDDPGSMDQVSALKMKYELIGEI